MNIHINTNAEHSTNLGGVALPEFNTSYPLSTVQIKLEVLTLVVKHLRIDGDDVKSIISNYNKLIGLFDLDTPNSSDVTETVKKHMVNAQPL